MSRSYKKNPISKDGNRSKKYARTKANRIVRRRQNWDKIGDYNSYRRLNCQYDIYDSWSRYTLNEQLEFRTRWIAGRECGRYHDGYSKYDHEYYNINTCIKKWKKWYYWK